MCGERLSRWLGAPLYAINHGKDRDRSTFIQKMEMKSNLSISSIAAKVNGRLERWYKNNQQYLIQKRFYKRFHDADHCYISQNCIGGRFYELEGRGYTSPTVGLWFKPTDFLSFCKDLETNLNSNISLDSEETAAVGILLVGSMG
jgi:hypothetical protein